MKPTINRKIVKNEKFYLVSWRDFNSSYNSWEPSKSLDKVKDLLQKYDKANPIPLKSVKLLKSKRKPSHVSKKVSQPKAKTKCKDIYSKNKSKMNITKNNAKDKTIIGQNYTSVLLKPKCILKLDIYLNGNLYALVEWENSSISTINYDFLKHNYPSKLIEFYESRITFPFENNGTILFKNKHNDSI